MASRSQLTAFMITLSLVCKGTPIGEHSCGHVIIWDELSAQHCHVVEAVKHMLYDVCNIDHPFSGLIVIVGGYFLQMLPVVLNGV